MVELWYQALHSEVGIEVQCFGTFEEVKGKLTYERQKLQDEDLAAISICHSPFDPERLWLVKRKRDDQKG